MFYIWKRLGPYLVIQGVQSWSEDYKSQLRKKENCGRIVGPDF